MPGTLPPGLGLPGLRYPAGGAITPPVTGGATLPTSAVGAATGVSVNDVAGTAVGVEATL